MDKIVFFEILKAQANKIDIKLKENELEKFYSYMKSLIEWNKKINLTAITEPEDIIRKHFIDSLTINKYIDENMKVIDVGTGAGFPGVPLKILRDDLDITLLDSLNKRLIFLDEVIKENDLKNIKAIHYRVEDVGKSKNYREMFDIAVSRAVAPLNVLVEYLLPLVKINGKCICMKGSNVEEEINIAKSAIAILGGKIDIISEFSLPNSDMKRNIIIIRKVKDTPNKYPRKPGIPSKEPIS